MGKSILYSWFKITIIFILISILGISSICFFEAFVYKLGLIPIDYIFNQSGELTILMLFYYSKNIFIYSLLISILLYFGIFLFSRINNDLNKRLDEDINHKPSLFVFSSFVYGGFILLAIFLLFEITIPNNIHKGLLNDDVQSHRLYNFLSETKKPVKTVANYLSKNQFDEARNYILKKTNIEAYPYNYFYKLIISSSEQDLKELHNRFEEMSTEQVLIELGKYGDEKKSVSDYDIYLFFKSLQPEFPLLQKKVNELATRIKLDFSGIDIFDNEIAMRNYGHYYDLFFPLRSLTINDQSLQNLTFYFRHTLHHVDIIYFKDITLTGNSKDQERLVYKSKFGKFDSNLNELTLYDFVNYGSTFNFNALPVNRLDSIVIEIPYNTKWDDILFLNASANNNLPFSNFSDMYKFSSKPRYLHPVALKYNLFDSIIQYIGLLILVSLFSIYAVSNRVRNKKIPFFLIQYITSFFTILIAVFIIYFSTKLFSIFSSFLI